MEEVKIKYKDEVISIKKGTTLLELSKKYKDNYKYDILSGSINNRLSNLST